MNFFSDVDATTMMVTAFISLTKDRKVKLGVLTKSSGRTLFVHVSDFPHPVCGNETSLFGKAFRFLYHMHEGDLLDSYIRLFGITKIIFIEAVNVENAGSKDMLTFQPDWLIGVMKQIDNLGTFGSHIHKTAIEALINENAHN